EAWTGELPPQHDRVVDRGADRAQGGVDLLRVVGMREVPEQRPEERHVTALHRPGERPLAQLLGGQLGEIGHAASLLWPDLLSGSTAPIPTAPVFPQPRQRGCCVNGWLATLGRVFCRTRGEATSGLP